MSSKMSQEKLESYSEYWLLQYEKFFKAEEYNEAKDAIENAISMSSEIEEMSECYIKLSKIYAKLDNDTSAINSAFNAVKLLPKCRYIKYLLALINIHMLDNTDFDAQVIDYIHQLERTHKSGKLIISSIIIFNNLQKLIEDIESEIDTNKKNDKENNHIYPILSFLFLMLEDFDKAYELNEEISDDINYFEYRSYVETVNNTIIGSLNYLDYLSKIEYDWIIEFLPEICSNFPSRAIFLQAIREERQMYQTDSLTKKVEEFNDILDVLSYWKSGLLKKHPESNILALKCIDCFYDTITLLAEVKQEEKARLEQIAKGEERNRIMANLSHSIKNMLRSVIDPLLLIKKEIPEKAKIIDDALKGTNLIREMVNAINLSYKTTLEDLTYDIAHHGKDSVSLNEMIVNSLKYSIGNMFDDKYFPQYMEKYFPKREVYQQANADWNRISGTNSITDITEFAVQHMFNLKLDGSEVANYMIGNEKSSAIKLMILFQEIIFNAVKYSCYVPKTKRHIEISLTEHDNKLSFKVFNSYNSKVQPKSTGVGKLIIENFAKVLGCEPVITTENEVYSIIMEFKDYWREK